MFKNTKAFSGFSVDDIVEARRCYSEALGLRVTEEHGMLTLHIAGSRDTLVYPKEDHSPASYTSLNLRSARESSVSTCQRTSTASPRSALPPRER